MICRTQWRPLSNLLWGLMTFWKCIFINKLKNVLAGGTPEFCTGYLGWERLTYGILGSYTDGLPRDLRRVRTISNFDVCFIPVNLKAGDIERQVDKKRRGVRGNTIRAEMLNKDLFNFIRLILQCKQSAAQFRANISASYTISWPNYCLTDCITYVMVPLPSRAVSWRISERFALYGMGW